MTLVDYGSVKKKSCDSCRLKKTRCDADQARNIPCSACMVSNQRCIFSLGPNRSSSKAYVEALEKRSAELEKLLHRLAPQTDLDSLLNNSSKGPSLAPPGGTHIQDLATRAIDFCLDPDSLTLDPIDSDFTYLILANRIKALLDTNDFHFLGKSSSGHFVETAFQTSFASKEPRDFISVRRLRFWQTYHWEKALLVERTPVYTFPDDDLIASLMQLYFRKLNAIIPVLHRPTFERHVRDRLHLRDEKFAALLLTVCAIGSRFSNDPRCLADGETSLLSNGWRWFNQIELLRKSWLKPPSLCDLQLACLAVMFLHSGTAPHLSWTLLGVAVRLAQDVGAHRRRPANEPLTVEAEQWKRVWWVLVCLDRMMSSATGRPCAVHQEDCDVELPVECDDEYWEHPDPAQAFKQPINKPSTASCFIWFIKVTNLTSVALKTLYGIKSLFGISRTQYQEYIVTGLDSAMNKWLDSVPDHLRWDPNREDPLFFDQSAMLYSSYYHLQILVHRPFIPSPNRQVSALSYPSLAICTNAARSCCHLLEAYIKRRSDMPFSQVPAFTSAVILLLYVWSSKKSGTHIDTARYMADVEKCIAVLERTETRWSAAGKLRDILMALASSNEGHEDEASHPPLKRTREQIEHATNADFEWTSTSSVSQGPMSLHEPVYHFPAVANEDQLLFPFYSDGMMGLTSDQSDPSDQFYAQLQTLADSDDWRSYIEQSSLANYGTS